jgi:hemoglobin
LLSSSSVTQPIDPARSVAPSVRSASERTVSHYEAIGGGDAVARLVQCFYAAMDGLPEMAALRALHPPELAPVREVLTRYLSEWMGGPALYASERGQPRLRKRHLPFTIGPAERDAWMTCMRAALASMGSVANLRASANEPGNVDRLDQVFVRVAESRT